MTYTEDRLTFEAQLRQPPHFARMCDHAGKFVSRMTKVDRESVLEMAWNTLWEWRDGIHETNDILRLWINALSLAVKTRKTWLIWTGLCWRRVRNSQLGRDE